MNTRSYARQVLEGLGFAVEDIPTSHKEESDFLASINNCVTLIEEKTKFDDLELLKKREDILSRNKRYTSQIPLVRDNRLSGIVCKAVRQLRSSSENKHSFRLVWFTGAGIKAEAQYRQFIATIYGTTNIVEQGCDVYRCCYFFRNSEFFRHSSILDGAVAAYISRSTIHARLCLNPLSPNFQALRSSAISAAFNTKVEDPKLLEESGMAFILDGDINRNDELALLQFLQKKYNTAPLMRIDLGYLSSTHAVQM